MTNSIIEESKKARRGGILGILKIFKKKKFLITGLVIIVVFSGAYFVFGREKTQSVETKIQEWTIKNDDIKVAVEYDGKVVAESGVELSFSLSDDNLEIKEVFVKEGDKVSKGDKIASVSTDTLELSLRTTLSSYQSTLADYNETIAGASEEDIASAKDKITSAEIALEQGRISLENTKQSAEESIRSAERSLKDAKENLEDNQDELSSESVKDAYEDLVDNIKSVNISLDSVLADSDEIIGVDNKFINDDFELSLGVKKTSSLINAQGSYIESRDSLEELNNLALVLSKNSSYSEIDQATKQTEATLDYFEDHLYDMKVMLDASVTTSDLTQTELDGFISTITSDRTSINTKITTLNTKISAVDDAKDGLDDYVEDYEDALRDLENAKADAERSIKNAEASVTSKELSLEQVNRDYEDLLAPLTDSELASARSKLTSASVSLEKARYELEKATLTSPIDGEVVMLNYKAGDIIIDDSKSVAVILNSDTLFIEANVEESDISNLKVGQKAYVTFDSLDELTLEGEISFISLTSETSNNGIVTYLVRVLFNKGEHQVREGMTAYLEFVTSEAKDVLIAPVSAIRNVDGKPSAQIATGEWQAVITGFTDGKYVEIISGLEEGDKILY